MNGVTYGVLLTIALLLSWSIGYVVIGALRKKDEP